MRIGVVGAVMHDQIETVEGRVFESFGGILYNALALAAITRPQDEILPVSYMAEDHIAAVQRDYFDAYPQIRAANIRPNAAGTDSNILKYVTPSSRREKMTIVTPPFDPTMFDGIAGADAVLVNFINGGEMDLATFQALRARIQGPVYLDVHNLGKLRENGVPVPHHRFNAWAEWFACVDIVQANEWEAERLLGIHPRSEEEMRAAVLRLIAVPGPRIATLTLGEIGCAMAWRGTGNAIHYARIPAIPGLRIVDTTGCGDAFSAGFLMRYLRTGSPLESALFAATLSGLNCLETGLDGLRRAANVEEMMEDAYGELLREVRRGWTGEAVVGKDEG